MPPCQQAVGKTDFCCMLARKCARTGRSESQQMDHLKTIPLLAGLDSDLCDGFSKRCAWRTYQPHELIIDHHEQSHDVRFIITGSARIVVRMVEGREVIFNDCNAGEFFGELAAIDGGARSASVTAVTKVRLCIMPQAVFKEICDCAPEIAWRIMNHLVANIRRLSDRLSEFSFLKAKHRLYAELLRLSRPRQLAQTGADDDAPNAQRIISPAPPQSDIADRIASRREIVSREMKALERIGVLERSKGGVIIADPDRLQRMASEGWN
ncbi:MAG: Crp/Fnr family transcriptional regulator, partial [Pseudomonadota bacterium]